MRLEAIEAGKFKLDGGAMFGVVPRSIWEKLNPPDSKNLCTWSMRLLFLEIDNHKILIDTGMGNKQSEKFFSHYEPSGPNLDESLNKIGINREDITDVLLTHLHFDHCGGALIQNHGEVKLGFPNAKYWTHRSQWDWAIMPNGREKASFLKENLIPLKEKKVLYFIEELEWIAGIQLRLVHGHTEGMMIPYIKFQDKTIIFCADLLPSIGHIPLPYIMAYDTRPLITLVEKEEFLNEAAIKNYILFLEHDPIHECCTVESSEKGIKLKDTFSLDSIIWH